MKNIIGIFGLICSGKSSFSKLLAKELNALYIDADIIGHEALNDKIKKEELIKEFSSDILDNNGNIDRKKLGKIVFGNSKKLRILESINYPYIEDKVLDSSLRKENNLENEKVEVSKKLYKVDIKGAVVNPGVYEVEENSRVIDIINLAGGLLWYANTTTINLSKFVSDEMVIVIYSKEEVRDFLKLKEKI